jgi:hypothetical protein
VIRISKEESVNMMTSVVGFHKDKQKELSLAIETNQVKKRFNAFSEKYKYTQDIRILY